jgi:hypothetical protein
MELPLYKIHIDDFDEATGVDAIAIVTHPAIEKSFMAFTEQKPIQLYFSESGDRRIVTGALMIADMPIYRNVAGKEFYVQFDAQTIEAIAQRFFEKGYQKNVNLQHDGNILDGIVMYESMIVDKERGMQFQDLPEGSWVGSFKVNNDEVWQLIKSGTMKGFSVEGIFNHIKIDEMPVEELEEIRAGLVDLEYLMAHYLG